MSSKRKSPEEIEANKEQANRKRKLRRLWSYSDLSFEEVCDEMGLSHEELIKYAASLGLTNREEPVVYIPTPEQIRIAAAEVRSKWSPADVESRLGAGAFGRMNNATEQQNDDSRTAFCARRERGPALPKNRRPGS
jgi:hypothetical protein